MKAQLALTALISFTLLTTQVMAEKPREKQVVVAQATLTELYDLYGYPAKVESKIHAYVIAESTGVLSSASLNLGRVVKAQEKLFALKHTDPAYRGGSVQHYSPVNGVLSEVYQSVGSTIAQGEKVLLITDPSQIKMKIEVSAAQVRDLKIGMPGSLTIPYDKEAYEVVITGLSPILDSITGTSTAELELKDEKNAAKVLVGTLGKVSFKVGTHQGLQVPEHAIIYEGKKPQIRLVQEEKLLRRSVELGEKREGKIEVLTGLNAGDTYVLRANTYIKDGEKVVVSQ